MTVIDWHSFARGTVCVWVITEKPIVRIIVSKGRHTMKVARTTRYGAWGMCSCGWRGPAKSDIGQARADAAAHMAQVEPESD